MFSRSQADSSDSCDDSGGWQNAESGVVVEEVGAMFKWHPRRDAEQSHEADVKNPHNDFLVHRVDSGILVGKLSLIVNGRWSPWLYIRDQGNTWLLGVLDFLEKEVSLEIGQPDSRGNEVESDDVKKLGGLMDGIFPLGMFLVPLEQLGVVQVQR